MLGYDRPRKIRELIERLVSGTTPKLRDVYVRPMTGRTLMPKGGTRETQVNEFWLTRREALLIATQSETQRAWEMTETIVAVFEAVLDGKAPRVAHAPVAPAFSMQEMSVAIASAVSAAMMPVVETLRAEMRDLDRRVAHPQLPAPALTTIPETDLTAGTRYAREITSRITRAAHTAVAAEKGTFGKVRKEFEDRVRTAVGFPRDRGHRWENLPMSRLEEARLAVARIEGEVQDQAREHFRASQLRLIPGGANT
jgi:hypothetical protein